jgi:hypothetical protein
MQVWFPSNYTLVAGQFAGTTALDTFTFMLANLPATLFTSTAYPALNASGVQVSLCYARACAAQERNLQKSGRAPEPNITLA